MSVRTNLADDPHALNAGLARWDYAAGTGGAVTTSWETGTDTPDGRPGYFRTTINTASTGGTEGPRYRQDGTESGLAGDVLTLSFYYRSTTTALNPINVVAALRSGGSTVNNASSSIVAVVGEWVRASVTITAAGAYDGFQLWVNEGTGGVPAAGNVIDVTQMIPEKTSVLGDYFDGGTLSTGGVVNAWTGTENASTSTQTIAEVSAALLTTDQPQPVQVLVADVAAGESYLVEGVTGDGRTWAVPGGAGVSDGGQVRMVDNRAPVNVPVSYQVTVGQDVLTSNQVTVSWVPPDGDSPRFLIQSLDGSVLVPVRQWWDNALPQAPEIRSTKFPIRGRSRPVVVLQPAADGDAPVQVLLSREASESLREALGLSRDPGTRVQGGAVCVRTTGNERDLAPTRIAVIMAASSALFPNDGVSTSRLWDLTLTWIDDPEPSTIPTVFTWGDVDTLLGVTMGLTWGEVDDMFSDLTWADVDATDWGSVEP